MNVNMRMAFEVANTFMEDFTIDSRITTQKKGNSIIIDVIKNKKNQHIFVYLSCTCFNYILIFYEHLLQN